MVVVGVLVCVSVLFILSAWFGLPTISTSFTTPFVVIKEGGKWCLERHLGKRKNYENEESFLNSSSAMIRQTSFCVKMHNNG